MVLDVSCRFRSALQLPTTFADFHSLSLSGLVLPILLEKTRLQRAHHVRLFRSIRCFAMTDPQHFLDSVSPSGSMQGSQWCLSSYRSGSLNLADHKSFSSACTAGYTSIGGLQNQTPNCVCATGTNPIGVNGSSCGKCPPSKLNPERPNAF